MSAKTRIVEVRENVLKQNDIVARALRQQISRRRSFRRQPGLEPGSGKTMLLEKTLTLLRQQYRVAALVGDLATENDAARLARSQAPVKQITTGTLCHLEAAMVRTALEGWDLDELDFLFIENVGNLVCPSSYDLGEDLAPRADVRDRRRRQAAEISDDLQQRRCGGHHQDGFGRGGRIRRDCSEPQYSGGAPGMEILDVSVKSGAGMDEFLDFLRARRADAQTVLGARAAT